MLKRGMEMPNYCAYRAEGTDQAAKAAYEEFRKYMTEDDDNGWLPDWETLSSHGKEAWRRIFRAGHKAYREVIKAEIDRVKDGIPGSATGRIEEPIHLGSLGGLGFCARNDDHRVSECDTDLDPDYWPSDD